MRTEILLNLQANFLPYSPFWDEWKVTSTNTLNKLEKGILEAYLQADFQVSLKEWKVFLKQLPLIATISEKLCASRKDLDQWLIDKFIAELVVIIHVNPEKKYHDVPLHDLEDLNFFDGKLSGKLAAILKKFGYETITDLAPTVIHKDFCTQANLAIVREFLFQCKIERLVFGMIQGELRTPLRNSYSATLN